MRKCPVNAYFVKLNAFVRKSLDHKILCGNKCRFWKRLGAKAVLIRNHHQHKIRLASDASHVGYRTGQKPQLFEQIYLKIVRFADHRAVSIDE